MASEVEIAWAAGLFEGEGCATIVAGRQPRLQLTMTDQDVVERFYHVVGRGAVREYAGYGVRRKRAWHWTAQSAEDVLFVAGLIWPHLGARRQERLTEVVERAMKMGEPRSGGGHHSTGLCKQGHDLTDPQHLYVHAKTGKRHCRTCRAAYQQRWNERRRVLRLRAN